MVPEEKAKYERMAAEDRERYNRECAVSVIVLVRAILPAITAGACVWRAISRRRVTVSVTCLYLPKYRCPSVLCVQIRDEEVLRQQEERRKAHAVGGETDTRMRHSTVRVPGRFGCPGLKLTIVSFSVLVLQVANSGQSSERADVAPRERKVSREEQERIDQRREVRGYYDTFGWKLSRCRLL
jgi:hypothetical protein